MKRNKSAARAMDLLLLLAESKDGLTLLEIENALEIPKSSTFELVYTLVDKMFLEQKDRKFSIGINAFRIGFSYTEKLDLVLLAKNTLEELAKQTNETVFLGRYVQNQVIYVDKHIGDAQMAYTCKVGTTKELYCTALGKAILARISEKEVEDYFRTFTLEKFTERTIVTIEKMKIEIMQIRQRGYSIENGEGSKDVYCIGAPIMDYKNEVMGAISVTSPSFQMSEEKSEKFGNLIAEAALMISRKLGYGGIRLYAE